jgi:hypothetical protein
VEKRIVGELFEKKFPLGVPAIKQFKKALPLRVTITVTLSGIFT